MTPEQLIPKLLALAWLLPLVGFSIEVFGGYWQKSRTSKAAAGMAVFCIATGFVLSLSALLLWGNATHWEALSAGAEHHSPDAAHHSISSIASTNIHPGGEEADHTHHNSQPETSSGLSASQPITGTFYYLAKFGDLEISIDYYIDSLTLVMFVMVTLIASCIHVFAMGYMSDELTDDHEDHEVHLSGGGHFHRPGRFYRFFSYMSLFCFSMLGLVLAGNIFQVFIFWELVGICSYLLIGFYIERKTASTAANKAFIMNRVGDFGFLIGLMILFTYFNTFRFYEPPDTAGHQAESAVSKPAGLFQQVRDGAGELKVVEGNVYLHSTDGKLAVDEQSKTPLQIPYYLLVIAGLGVFGGCVGKSAQFPLQTWLPDAMEGPTPVSALVHSATMVAAGVYLVGRFFPMFTPEVLLIIAYVGCITLFLGATIAIVATDIKRVLAYSTISQLGYMMLALGVAGWGAGLFHLVTHAFFKSLMFLCSGSVIYGCHHVQEMPRMGGLRKKMPITAYTMLVGVIAISGLSLYGAHYIFGEAIAFSGYHSKDAIVATSLAYMKLNPIHFLLFLVPLVTAGITGFYMFRLWFYTFAGEPRDQEVYDHCHESPRVMTIPLLILSLFAAGVAIGGEEGPLYRLLINSEPIHIANGLDAGAPSGLALPAHHAVHESHHAAGVYATIVAFAGLFVAWVFYGVRLVDPADIKKQFAGMHEFLQEKWHFDTLYDVIFVRPAHVIARCCAAVDALLFDEILHASSRLAVRTAEWGKRCDELVIDGLVDGLAGATFAVGRAFSLLQTGRLRQYIMFIAVGVVAVFVLVFVLLPH